MKRAICAGLMAVGLLAAAAVPAGAFADAQEITYTEAVSRAAEQGFFVGTDGKFMPRGTVTRAQMATIIVKMLHGADYNADGHKGNGRFPDTAAFESGWAEGYINLCAEDGVVSGYGDGTFQPGNRVTAAEAVTMLLNAMDIDAGVGSWPDTVMNKAKELHLFDGLNEQPESGTVLNREQLAVLIMAMLDQQEKPTDDSKPSGGSSSDSKPSGGGSSGSRPVGGSSSGSTSGGGTSTKEPPQGVESDKADLTKDNVFLLTAVPAQDGKAVEVKLELRGKVDLCGFDLKLCYDEAVYSLKELDTEHDLQIYSHTEQGTGKISFNYASATNITKEKTVLTAVFDVVGQGDETTVFSLQAEEVIRTEAQEGYAVAAAEYTLTYCRPE